jgi:hypothetical protein
VENSFLRFGMQLAGFCCTLFEALILLASFQKRAQPVDARAGGAIRPGKTQNL